MNIHLDLNTLIAFGVGAHLLGAVAKTVLKAPKQQAQIDAIEAKLDATLNTLSAVVATSSPNTSTPKGVN